MLSDSLPLTLISVTFMPPMAPPPARCARAGVAITNSNVSAAKIFFMTSLPARLLLERVPQPGPELIVVADVREVIERQTRFEREQHRVAARGLRDRHGRVQEPVHRHVVAVIEVVH